MFDKARPRLGDTCARVAQTFQGRANRFLVSRCFRVSALAYHFHCRKTRISYHNAPRPVNGPLRCAGCVRRVRAGCRLCCKARAVFTPCRHTHGNGPPRALRVGRLLGRPAFVPRPCAPRGAFPCPVGRKRCNHEPQPLDVCRCPGQNAACGVAAVRPAGCLYGPRAASGCRVRAGLLCVGKSWAPSQFPMRGRCCNPNARCKPIRFIGRVQPPRIGGAYSTLSGG